MELVHLGQQIKLYGPYPNKGMTNRKIVVIRYPDGTQKSQSWSRFVVENSLGYQLDKDIEIDHIDRNHTNDNLDNLQLLPKDQHMKKDAMPRRMVNITCVLCGKITAKRWKDYISNRKHGKSGPYCGKRCAGVASTTNQMRAGPKLNLDNTYLIYPPSIHGEKVKDILSPFGLEQFNLLSKYAETFQPRGAAGIGRQDGLKSRCSQERTGSTPVLRTPELPKFCPDCSVEIKRRSTRCKDCAFKKQNKIKWPPTEELVRMVQDSSYLAIGRRLGVSDNAIRKRIKHHS